MSLTILLKVTKNQGSTLSLENAVLEYPLWVKLTPPAVLELRAIGK